MKRLVSFSALVALFAGGLVASPAQAAVNVGWDVATLDWALSDNLDTPYSDIVVRDKARLSLNWDQSTESNNCVAWHVDGADAAAYTHAISSTTETRTTDANLIAGGSLRELELVYTWSELINKFTLDPTVTHTVRVAVHNVSCDLADIGTLSESAVASSTLSLTAGAADSQNLEMFSNLSLAEVEENSTEQPDLGGTPNADKWIYQGETAFFDAIYLTGASEPWNGPVFNDGTEMNSANVCFIDVVNIDDAHVDPETGNVSQGYDFMNIGWFSEGVTSNVGSADYTYYDPKYTNTTTVVGWNGVIANGWSDWNFDPTKNNSITRYMFEGNCYDLVNYGTASGSSSDPNVPVNTGTNYTSTTRYSNNTESNSIGYYSRWNYYWHGRSQADIAADFWAMRDQAAAFETVYLGPAAASVSENNESVDAGESVDIDSEWFDGDNQCVAVFVDGNFYSSYAPGADGAGTSTDSYTWADLVYDFELDSTVSHTIEWRLFNGACADIDETTATPMDTASIDVNPVVPEIDFDTAEIGPDGSANLDFTWNDPYQCLAFFVDGEYASWEYLEGNSGNGSDVGSETLPGTWLEWIDFAAYELEADLDLTVEHLIEFRIYDDYAPCFTEGSPTIDSPYQDGASLNLLPLAPVLEPSVDEVGPGGTSDLDIDRDTYGGLLAAQYIDGVFVGCAVVSDIPTVIDWGYLDDSYSRDDSHDVTFQVFPFFGDNIDMNQCDESVIAGLTPITEGTVYLVPDAVEPTPEEELAETGVSANGIAWIAFLTLATGVALTSRRRRETARS